VTAAELVNLAHLRSETARARPVDTGRALAVSQKLEEVRRR